MDISKIPIVFFGTPDFAVASLDALLAAGCDVRAVVTATDKPAGRGHKLLASAVKQYALVHGIPVLQPANLKDEAFHEQLRATGAELFIVIAFRMLPRSVWAMPRLGTFNVHASLLPRYRGAAPINRAIMAGETITGVSTFFLSEEIDTGDVIGRLTTEITPEDNAGTLHDRLMALGAQLAVSTVRQIAAGEVKPVSQSVLEEETAPCPAPKIFKEDCRIDWSADAVCVHNHIRGLSPWPGAWTGSADGAEAFTAKILESAVANTESSCDSPGTVKVVGDTMTVACGKGSIAVLALQPSGKRRMSAAEYLHGARDIPSVLS